ncbi:MULTISPECIES: penicillin-binding protein 1A [unclassified Mucilaginibacter]|uniref:penicillin-binding protein 1A n=1 Tax=unclassified Mucilaginibacter TaxID=2617802 RepID=UPI0009691B9A|nr:MULTISPECIES: transglycosylase domain-containing protein [unclassified Mucilaginibacter]OJW14490.1 MAG: peptidase [Mucilaginibacter sp. 44-25]PLW90932.1 MAG: peptidase [Mucilaginibacter sp.]HEK21617.1 penicillin-binding protein [Bacteroidota bacterium]
MKAKLSQQDIKRYNWYIWRFFIACFAVFAVVLFLIAFQVFGPLPSFRELENPKSDQASEVISSDKQVIGKYYIKNRTSVTYKQISPNVINALVATEDARFFEHSGIDFQRTFTIVLYNLVGKKQGGSTITQQLALNLFSERSHNPFKRVVQKLQEWITAVKLERNYTKEEILTLYLNTVDFGAYNTFGISSASRTYFNVTPDKLTPDQAALLIGMINGPGIYSPINHPDNALNRRNFVLRRMAEENYLSAGQAEEFKGKPLGLKFNPIDHNDGIATYFRAVLKKEVQKIMVDKAIFKPDGVTPYDLDRDGLKIYTTINATMQQYAEDAQKEYMRNLQAQFNAHWKGISLWKTIPTFKSLLDKGMKRSDRYIAAKQLGKSDEEIREEFNTPAKMNLFTWRGDIDTLMKPIDSIVYCKMMLRNAMMSMDPTTGYIKAWVGGTNFEHFKYDQVKMGTRQVGSTAKPFTYTVAVENGFSPCMQVPNEPITITGYGTPWSPRSSPSETVPGVITLRTALARSQNWVTAYVMNEVKPQPVADLIKKMGITSPVPPYPSICLGTFDASVFDMTGAYSAFANQGVWTEPTYLLRIEDKNGNVLYNNSPRVVQAINEQTAYVMTYMLKAVIDEGTGWRMRGTYKLMNPIGGKTGTTNDNSDGWFIGITPQLVTGVWTGCEDRDIHFRSTRLGEGANTALPIFALYMKRVYANPELGIKKNVDFVPPKSGLSITLDCNAYSQQQTGQTEVEKKLDF